MSRDDRFYTITHDAESVTLQFKWTVSRGRDTDGYNICTLYVNGRKAASCNGGGYDMEGTCLAEWFQKEAADKLPKLPSARFDGKEENDHSGFYGLFHYDKRGKGRNRKYGNQHTQTYLDGGCGFSSMESIIKALGYKLEYLRTR